jgi:hypothetical protein
MQTANRGLRSGAIALLLAMAGHVYAAPPQNASETNRLAFVNEYIRELSEQEAMRKETVSEMHEPGEGTLMPMIHYATEMRIALSVDINTMTGMHLTGMFKSLPKQIAQYLNFKYKILSEMQKIASTTVEATINGRKPGIDYGKMVAAMPKLRAQLESVDESFTTISALVFATLGDQKPDKRNHLSHLIITKRQRNDLLRELRADFGIELRQKDPPALAVAAGFIDHALRNGGYKYADDPWN